jgi:uncharacterized protein (DUF433 family)
MTQPLTQATATTSATLGVCSGQLVFTGTRVLVACVLAQLEAGIPRHELASDYPSLTPAMLDWAESQALEVLR